MHHESERAKHAKETGLIPKRRTGVSRIVSDFKSSYEQK
jgi:hypothetical protein